MRAPTRNALLINAMAALAIISAIVAFVVGLTGCGTDGAVPEQLPTQVQADPSKGEVSVKGDKGDKGDKGEVGPAGPAGKDGKDGAQGATGPKGDTGATGATGANGQDEVQGFWKDQVTGKLWAYVQGRYTYAEAQGLCPSPWRLPTANELQAAVQRSMTKAVTITNQISPDYVVSSETSGANAVTVIFASTDERAIATKSNQAQTNSHRVFCIKPD